MKYDSKSDKNVGMQLRSYYPQKGLSFVSTHNQGFYQSKQKDEQPQKLANDYGGIRESQELQYNSTQDNKESIKDQQLSEMPTFRKSIQEMERKK